MILKVPRGETSPADTIGAAATAVRIATDGEADECEAITSASAHLGKSGGPTRAKKLTTEQQTDLVWTAANG